MPFWVPYNQPPTVRAIRLTYTGERVGWMAQYPGEKEVTFPPYTCLESHGDPRVEQTEEGELIIFPL